MATSLQSDSAGPPIPRGRLPILGHALQIGRDPLGTIERWTEEVGDFYRIDIPGRNTWVVNRPEEIERIFLHGQNFTKAIDVQRASAVFGNGLVLSEGELWKKQRRMMQPAFHKERIAAYGARMVDLTEQALAAWVPGDVRDIHKDAMALTLKIATDTLFGDDEVPSTEVGESLEAVTGRFDGAMALFPGWLPFGAFARYRAAVARLDKIVYDVLARRRAHKTERGDLLSILLNAQDDGVGMSDRQIRDEVLTLLLAGHETIANALTWTSYLLGQHPEVEQQVFDEVDALGAAPTSSDLPRLSYTAAVLNESMRLYPPVWMMSRQVLDEWTIAGCRIGRGLQVAMFPWIVHRDPRFFIDPLKFRPERWLDGSTKSLPSYAYFPFGGGQRLCIGRSFALLEGTLVIATVARRYRLRSVSAGRAVPVPSITLRPRGGLPMRVQRR